MAGSFFTIGDPNLFEFLYYSFNHFVFNAISEIRPASSLAKSLMIFQGLVPLFIGIIFVGLLVSVRTQKYSLELANVISDIEDEGRKLETAIKEEFRIGSIEDALREIDKLETGMAKLLLLWSAHLK